MPTIDEMQVVVNAKTEGMRAELAKGAQSVKEFAEKSKAELGGMLGLMSKLGAAGASGGALGLLGAAAKMHPTVAFASEAAGAMQKVATFREEHLKWATDLQVLSRETGITTQHLQELGFAADKSEIQQKDLAAGLKTLKGNLDEAAGGTGSLIDVFKEYGITMKYADGTAKSYEELLRELANAIGRTEDESDKAKIALAAFGSAGKDLLPIFEDGAAGLDKFAEKAREAGKVTETALLHTVELIDIEWQRRMGYVKKWAEDWKDFAKSVAGATIEMAKGAEWVPTAALEAQFRQARDRVAETRAQIEALTAEVNNAPARTGLMADLGKATGGVVGQTAGQELEEAVQRLRGLEAELKAAQKRYLDRLPGWQTRTDPHNEEGGAAKARAQLFAPMERQIRSNKIEAERGGKSAGEVAALRAEEELLASAKLKGIELTDAETDRLEELKEELSNVTDARERARDAAREAREDEREAAREAKQTALHLRGLEEIVEREIRQNKAYGEGLGKTAGQIAAMRVEEELLSKAKHYGLTIDDELRKKLDLLKKKLTDVVDSGESWKQKLQQIQEVGRAVSSGLERAFGEFTKTGKVNFKEMTQSILQDLAMIAFRAAVISPLFGTGGNNQGLFGNLMGQLLGNFGGPRASGGSTDAGKTYLVGEEGPELLRMGGTPGTVIPANASRVMMGAARSASAGGQASADINVHVAAGPELLVTIDKRAERAVGAAAPHIAAAAVRTTERALPGMLRTAQQRRL